MQKIYYKDNLFSVEGAVSIEENGMYTSPWRIDFKKKDFFPFLNQSHLGEAAAGVRLAFSTDSTKIGIHLYEVLQNETGFHSKMTLDLVVNGRLMETLVLDKGINEYIFRHQLTDTNDIEIWLDQAWPVRFRYVLIEDGARISKKKDKRKRWVNYGSSISHSVRASSPATTWPAMVALERNLHLTNLGFGGNCMLEPMMIKVIRDLKADFFTIKPTANIINGTYNSRSYGPAIIGMIDTIRERHPYTPLFLISAIYCPDYEERREKTDISLSDMRKILSEIVDLYNIHGDRNIHYINGLDIMGAEALNVMSDRVHPDAGGQSVLAEGFIREVLDRHNL